MSCEDSFVLKKCIECLLSLNINVFRKGHNQCKECEKKKARCCHGKLKTRCLDCGGGSFCEHGKRTSNCSICKGGSICEHNKNRSKCRVCHGGSICEHGTRRSYCRKCKGGEICEHNRRKAECCICKGSQICEHNKIKHNCIYCNPECSCIECKLIIVNKKSQFYPLCQPCFCNKYPDHKKSTLYKIKERYLRDELRERFKEYTIDMIFDKAVDGGCSKRKPDVLIDCLTHSIVIECDEYQHVNYECENKRTMQIFKDLGNRPLVLIRFNPDSYTNENEEKIQGCFTPLIKVEDIHKKRFYNINETEWVKRVNILEKNIKEYLSLDTFPNKEVTEIKLFYSY